MLHYLDFPFVVACGFFDISGFSSLAQQLQEEVKDKSFVAPKVNESQAANSTSNLNSEGNKIYFSKTTTNSASMITSRSMERNTSVTFYIYIYIIFTAKEEE